MARSRLTAPRGRCPGTSLAAAALIALAAAAPLLGSSWTAAADDSPTAFHVTVDFDAADAVPGDGACDIGDGAGGCSIRAAVMEANARPEAGPYAVLIPAGTYQISLPGDSEDQAAGGDIDVRTSMTLRGAGQDRTIVRGHDLKLDHAFEVFWSTVVRFEDLTVCCSAGGGIRNRQGAIELSRTTLRDNSASFGGGVANDGIMTATDSLFLDNTGGQGGGIMSFTGGSLTIRRSRIEGNGDAQGGGANIQSALDMSDCVVQDNLGGHGGGLRLSEAPRKVIRNTTVAHNHASLHPEPPWVGYGGGIWNQAPDLQLINVTLSDNWGQGGGLLNLGQMTVTNSTLAGNGTHAWGAAIYNQGVLWIGNSIVGPSQAASCDLTKAALRTLGHNIDTDGTCALQGPDDRSRIDPLLGALADNTGFGWTHALLPGSPAIDAAQSAICPLTDARGKPRPYGPDCDIGAFERTADDTVPKPTATPSGGLRARYVPWVVHRTP